MEASHLGRHSVFQMATVRLPRQWIQHGLGAKAVTGAYALEGTLLCPPRIHTIINARVVQVERILKPFILCRHDIHHTVTR